MPAAKKNSDDTLPDDVIDASRDYPLYKRGTPSKLANVVADDSVIAASFDSKTQTFAAAARASVYRAFPASKKNDLNVDGDIQTLNADLTKQFASVNLPATDMRSNYRLVGAVWLDQPQRDFKLKARFDNPANVTSDDQTGAGIVAGEDRLSSMQMESFTQTDFEHCFRCHDTRGISDLSPPMSPKLMNVSHLPAMYLRTSGQ